jgi:hypothetical protein
MQFYYLNLRDHQVRREVLEDLYKKKISISYFSIKLKHIPLCPAGPLNPGNPGAPLRPGKPIEKCISIEHFT